MDYKDTNKRYINHQLTLAIPAGLATGASGIVQLSMTILDRALESKDWCSNENTEDIVVQSRRQVLDWTLHNLPGNANAEKTLVKQKSGLTTP